MGAIVAEVAALASGPNFACLTTLMPDGTPVASLMWIDADEDHLLLNTERHRLKYRNISTDPRVHVLIVDGEDPGHYCSVQGLVEEHVFGPEAREHIERMAEKYTGAPFEARRIVSERVLLRVRPLRQRVRDSSVVVE